MTEVPGRPSAPLTVGVVMPVLNNAGTIVPAIESILAQQPPPDEVIVIDGGSSDDTAAIASNYAGVRVLEQTDSGLGQARNQGVAELRTALLAFCDGDDRWTSDSLAFRRRSVTENSRCAVIGHVATEAAQGELSRARTADLGRPSPGYTPGALLVTRDVFDEVGSFDESLAIGTDSDWFVRLRQSSIELEVLDSVVLIKGLRSGSLSTDVEQYRRELLSVARRYVHRERLGDEPGE
jgi:glycosyltransferase involved in cell wall biosynthesis